MKQNSFQVPKEIEEIRQVMNGVNGNIVCRNDILKLIKDNPNITSDMLAAKMPLGQKLQDALLDVIKDLVAHKCVKCGEQLDDDERYDYEGLDVCKECFIQLIPQEGRGMMLNPSDEGGIPWEELG